MFKGVVLSFKVNSDYLNGKMLVFTSPLGKRTKQHIFKKFGDGLKKISEANRYL